jgi:RND superfamily putative drug exporter
VITIGSRSRQRSRETSGRRSPLVALARGSIRYRWWVVAGWILLVGLAAVGSRAVGGSFVNDLSVSGTDSQAAYDTMRESFPQLSGDPLQVVVRADRGLADPAVKSLVETSLARIGSSSDVAAVQSPYAPGGTVSADGTTAIITVVFTERAKDIPPGSVDAVKAAAAEIRTAGVQVEFGGPAAATETGPSGSEVIGLLAAVVVLLLVFGSLYAMVVPLLTALLALGLGISVVGIASAWISIGTAGPVVAAMIGLGVGIDYALLIVTRHREGLFAGHDPAESITTALATAGRSVLVAGSTVIVALLSLFLIGIPFVSALGLASAVTVASTLLAAVTLLPALLAVFGGSLDRFRVRPLRLDHVGGRDSGWHRWTRRIQRRPWPYLVASALALLVMAVPLVSIRLGTGDGASAPEGSTVRASYDVVTGELGAGWTGPLLVTATYDKATSRDQAQGWLDATRADLAATPGVAAVPSAMLNAAGDAAMLSVVPVGSPQDRSTEDLVHRVRSDVLPRAEGVTHVGGATATAVDLADRLGQRMVWFVAFVIGLSFLLLLVEFRSVFIPVKAAVMNLLSVGAAYGVVVAVFQWGWLSALFGVEPGPIESFAPMMLFAVLFGLSMDYEVFLLSRVREEYLRTDDAGRSVADGIAATARVITAAASVMVVVFASFLLNDQRVVNLFGFGLAVAIAIDATVVRLVLVPAVMAIAGRLAWWMPRRLDRLLPRIHVEPPQLDPFEAELDALDLVDEREQ